MTTWENSYFKDDLISHIVQMAKKEPDIATKIWEYFDPKYESIDKLDLPDRILSDPVKKLCTLYPNYGSRPRMDILNNLFNLIGSKDKVFFGIESTYRLFTHSCHGRFLQDEQQFQQWKNDVALQVVQMDHLGSLGSIKSVMKLPARLKMPEAYENLVEDLQLSANACTHMSFAWRAADYSDEVAKMKRRNENWPPLPKGFLTSFKNWKVYSFPTFVLLNLHINDGTIIESHVLTHKESLRLETLLRSGCRLVRHYHTLCSSLSPLGNFSGLIKFFKYFISTLLIRPNEVCRAWDVVYNMYLASLASDVWTKSYDEQRRKFIDGHYNEIVSYDDVLEMLSSFTPHDKLDILKIYKILPPPDFDPISGFWKNKLYHDTPWTYGIHHVDHNKLTSDLDISDQDFELFQVLQLFRRFHRLKGKLPGKLTPAGLDLIINNPTCVLSKFPFIKPSKIPLDQLKYIDYTGAGDWSYRNTDSPDIYSDKACPPNSKNLHDIDTGTDFYDLKPSDRNYLMHYLSQQENKDSNELMATVPNDPLFKQVTAHFKPESKKPDPRNFFSAKPNARILMSEWEYNVNRFMERDIAAFISKDPQQKAQALHELLGIDYGRDVYKVIHVSFDLDKFSPRYSPEGKNSSTRIWRKFFDAPNADKIPTLMTNANIHYFHHGMHFNYTTPVLDAEGMWGKTNTAYHEDVMAYAVRQLIKLKLLSHPGKLAVFIDDGLLTLKFTKDTSKEHIIKCMTYIEHVYFYLGYRISWDKTFVSEHYATFLSELYYNRAHIDQPFRAFLKMQRTKVVHELSPLAQVRGLCAMARSSMQLGIQPYVVMHSLALEVLAVFSQQVRMLKQKQRITPLEMALWLFTPHFLRGAGVPLSSCMLQNPGGDELENFFGFAQYMCYVTNNLTIPLNNIIEQQPKFRTALSFIRAPAAYSVTGHTLTEMKHYKLCAPRMLKFCQNQALHWVFSQDLNTVAETLVKTTDDHVSVSSIKQIYDSSPISVYDKFLSKIKRGATVMSLLTWRGRRKLNTSYRNEATSVICEFMDVVRHIP